VIVVSNSSPLVALARISRLNLLASIYKRILIPAEVHHEVTVAGLAGWRPDESGRSPEGTLRLTKGQHARIIVLHIFNVLLLQVGYETQRNGQA